MIDEIEIGIWKVHEGHHNLDLTDSHSDMGTGKELETDFVVTKYPGANSSP